MKQIEPVVAKPYIGCTPMEARGHIGGRAKAALKNPVIEEMRNRIVLRHRTVEGRLTPSAEQIAGKISCDVQCFGNLAEDAAFAFTKGLALSIDPPLCLNHDREQIYKLCGGNIGLLRTLIDNADIYGSAQTGLFPALLCNALQGRSSSFAVQYSSTGGRPR